MVPRERDVCTSPVQREPPSGLSWDQNEELSSSPEWPRSPAAEGQSLPPPVVGVEQRKHASVAVGHMVLAGSWCSVDWRTAGSGRAQTCTPPSQTHSLLLGSHWGHNHGNLQVRRAQELLEGIRNKQCSATQQWPPCGVQWDIISTTIATVWHTSGMVQLIGNQRDTTLSFELRGSDVATLTVMAYTWNAGT